MHYYACYFVLATMNYNCFKDFMEKRHYINKKKACMLDMYGIIIFSFFFFSFWLGNGRSKTYGIGIHTFVLLPHDFFEFRTKKKSATLEPSSHESLHVLQNCFELLRTSASHCKCTEGAPCQRCRNGLKKFNKANSKELLMYSS